MSNEQRIQTIKIVWKGDEAKSKVIELTRSIKGADDAVDQLNTMMGANATVTAKVAKNQKELTAERRKEATAVIRSHAQYTKLTTSLKQQVSLAGKSANQQEKLNALHRLGANATLSQKKEVIGLISAMQKQRVESGQLQGSMRGLRGQAQNIGWQMQDVAVQMQMGTDAMVIFSQQGSQLASGFGPRGAIIGALIAVGGAIGGVLFKSLMNANKEMKTSDKLIPELTKEYKKLTTEVQGLSRALVSIEITKQEKTLAEMNKTLRKNTKNTNEVTRANEAYANTYGTRGQWMNGVLDFFTDTNEQLTEQAGSTELVKLRIKALKDQLLELKQGYATDDLKEFKEALNQQILSLGQTERELKKAEAAKAGYGKETLKQIDMVYDTVEAYNAGVATIEALADAEKKRSAAIVASFKAEHGRSTKQTETVQQEYDRRKAIIDVYVAHKGIQDTKSAEAYVNLKKWETSALQKEVDRRNSVLSKIGREIQKGATDDPVLVAQQKHNRILAELSAEKIKLKEDEVDALNKIKELELQEDNRFRQAKADAEVKQMSIMLGYATQSASMMSTTIDLITNGAERVKQQTENMNGAQKAMFLVMQGVSAASAMINGISLGSQMAANMALIDRTGVSSATWLTLGTSIGAAQAGAIMGTTFAGTFDKGGIIPSGQKGIVSEYGDELVGGTMVYNNSSSGVKVTGREDTAKMMGGGGLNVTVVNNATGSVSASVQQLDEGNVKILIAEHFNNNIDRGVASSIGKKGSKSDKAIRQGYTTNRKY